MNTRTIFTQALLCCTLLFVATSAAPLEESKIAVPEIVIDATVQTKAHIEIPERVAKDLLKALMEALQNSKVSGEISAQNHVSTLGEESLKQIGGSQGRAGCDAGYCGMYCISLGFHGGYCTIYGACGCV
uniref:Invertebrate defensins family profile domain-containing protein n=1 Tax=Ceratitis capitata TaxID=7213 RepID=W8CDN1_CERCA